MKKNIIFIIAVILVITLSFGLENQTIVQAQDDISVNAKSYIVLDESGKVLKEKNSEKKCEVASICKLMTTLLTLEKIEEGNLSLDDKFLVSQFASNAEGSQAFLDANKEYTVRDLLKSVIVASANDSAIVLAENLAGTESNFVELMNNKAKILGMHNTVYANSTGLPAMEQYSTARDTAILLNEVSKYQLYREDCKIWMDSLIHSSGRKTELVNTNRLIKYYPNCITGKTGFTDEAGYCLASTASNNEFKLTTVVLGCSTSANRFTDSIALYNYCYGNYRSTKLISKDENIANDVKITSGKCETIILKPKYDFYYTEKINSNNNVDIIYELPERIKAPIEKGSIVGTILITENAEIIAKVPVIADENVEKQTYLDILNKIISNYSYIKNNN